MEKRILSTLLLIFALTAFASPISFNKKKLTRLNHSIEHIKAELSYEQKLKDHFQKQLKATELNVGIVSNQLHKTQDQLSKEKIHLKKLNQQKAEHQATIKDQQAVLSQQIQAAYLLPKPPFLKLLLGESDANKIDRIRMYYHFIAEKQANTISALHHDLDQLRTLEVKSKHQSYLLKQLQQQQQHQQQKIGRLKIHRQEIVRNINSQILTKNQRLKQLVTNKNLLEHTIQQIQKSQTIFKSVHFRAQKGELNWPMKGQIINKFGTKIAQSELRWQGIVIKAPLDQPVHAIANGKVVFADWMPGYGLLLIINHGDAYMSLYGRNHNLYYKVGDIVHQGDIIGRVGQSGGYNAPGLYFAIRHHVKPLNPTAWCHKQS